MRNQHGQPPQRYRFPQGFERRPAHRFVGVFQGLEEFRLGFDAALTPAVTLFGDTEMLLSGEAQSIAGSIGLKANF